VCSSDLGEETDRGGIVDGSWFVGMAGDLKHARRPDARTEATS